MQKILCIIILAVLVSCGSHKKTVNNNDYDWRVTVSSITTTYDKDFYPTFHFTLKNNTSKTISTFDATLRITYADKNTGEYVNYMIRSARWQTTLAPGQTRNYNYTTDDCRYDYNPWKYISTCRAVRVTSIRFSDGTVSY